MTYSNKKDTRNECL